MYHAFFSNFITRSLLLPLSLLFLFFFPIKIALLAIVLVILNFTYSSFSTLIVYHHKFGTQLFAEIISFGIILGSIFYFENFDLEVFLKIYIAAIAVKIVILSLQMNFWKERFSVTISINEFKYGFPFFILGLSGWLVSKVDIYAVNLWDEKKHSDLLL